MSKEFRCKGRRLADYLIRHGSKLIKKDCDKGIVVFVFEHDKSIDESLKQWEIDRKRCLF